jgi:hypothetical protein
MLDHARCADRAPRKLLRGRHHPPRRRPLKENPMHPRLGLAVWTLVQCVFLTSANAQGAFVNFEPPVSRGIDVARLGSHDFVLVCNVDDSTVEIIDTWNNALVGRAPVGLAPVTVRWVPSLGRFYTANYIGDSVSAVALSLSGSTPTVTLLRTENTVDAPVDVILNTNTNQLEVLSSTAGTVGYFDPNTLAVTFGQYQIDNFLFQPIPPLPRLMKEPRRIEYFGTKAFIINSRADTAVTLLGTHPTIPPYAPYRFALYRFDWSTISSQTIENDLGSANMGLAVASSGDAFVAGSLALNNLLTTATLKNAVVTGTGFVTSHLWLVSPSLTVSDRDLNLDAAGSRVPVTDRVSMPTDVAVLESGGAVQRAFVTSYQTDRIVMLVSNGQAIGTWPSQTIQVPAPTSGGYTMAGPRCLALKSAVPSQPSDPGARLYCLNRLDCSVSVFDPNATTPSELARIALAHDPSPPIVRSGRRFLFDARISTEGTVACASCHVDARTDGLAWRLGDASSTVGPNVPGPLVDGPVTFGPATPTFRPNKGNMVTQSLQGLLNHPINGAVRDLVTNAPYHWRGDKPDFTDFNEAFFNLMASPNVGTANDPRGLSTTDMDTFRGFIETVMYPPNPAEPKDRTYTTGTAAANGLVLFHTHPIVVQGLASGRSCVNCHALPEGSNNRVTVGAVFGSIFAQPIETPGLRGIKAREGKRLSLVAGLLVNVATAGLTHSGDGTASLTEFEGSLFAGDFTVPELGDMLAFVEQFDTGTAPMIGQVVTITTATGNWNGLGPLETEAQRANAGLTVHVQRGTAVLGLFFDVTQGRYVIEGTTLSFSRTDLQNAFVAGDLLIAESVPVGSERRLASASGTPSILTGPAPSGVLLEAASPPTQWVKVPSLTDNSSPLAAVPFVWNGNPTPTPKSIDAFASLQKDLINASVFGISVHRHEAPRRLRVTGVDIRLGAKLQLSLSTNSATPPPYAVLGGNTRTMDADLHPTSTFINGRRVWETTIELAPDVLYALMCGGPAAPGVQATLDGTPTPTQPLIWNLFHVVVKNEDGTANPGTWQQLTLL